MHYQHSRFSGNTKALAANKHMVAIFAFQFWRDIQHVERSQDRNLWQDCACELVAIECPASNNQIWCKLGFVTLVVEGRTGIVAHSEQKSVVPTT